MDRLFQVDKSLGSESVSQTNLSLQPLIISNAIGTKPVVGLMAVDVLNISSIRTDYGAYSVYALSQHCSIGPCEWSSDQQVAPWSLIQRQSDSYDPKIDKQSASSGASLAIWNWANLSV